MNDNDPGSRSTRSREPWNKGKLIGPKPPLRVSHVWSIRTKLQLEGRTRDLALFNLAIDSKLRGCDVVAVRVDDIAPNGYTPDRAAVRQKKTGRPVRFELTEQTRQALDDYLRLTNRKPGVNFLSNFDRVVDLDAEIADGALDLGVAEQELNGPKVTGSSVDQGRLGPPERVRAEFQRVETDAGNPLADEARILPGSSVSVGNHRVRRTRTRFK